MTDVGTVLTNGQNVTLREVYTLVAQLRSELSAKVDTVSANLEVQLTKHETEHEKHETMHQRDRDHRASLIRWAVTSITTGIGTLTAIYLAMKPG